MLRLRREPRVLGEEKHMHLKELFHELLFPRPSATIATLTAPSESEPTTRLADLSKKQTLVESLSVRSEPHTTGRIQAVHKPVKHWYKSDWTRLTATELVNKAMQYIKDVHGAAFLPRFIYLSDEQYQSYLSKTGQTKFNVGKVAISIRSDFEAPCALRNNQAFIVGIQEAK